MKAAFEMLRLLAQDAMCSYQCVINTHTSGPIKAHACTLSSEKIPMYQFQKACRLFGNFSQSGKKQHFYNVPQLEKKAHYFQSENEEGLFSVLI